MDASTYDEICIHCGATDVVPGGWGKLADPCPCPHYRPDHNGECLNCDKWLDAHGPDGSCWPEDEDVEALHFKDEDRNQ